MITSVRGPRGGHRLINPPDKITLGQVVRLLEAHSELVECGSNPDSCSRAGDCLVRHAWHEASQAMFSKLDALTIADLLKSETGEDGCTKFTRAQAQTK